MMNSVMLILCHLDKNASNLSKLNKQNVFEQGKQRRGHKDGKEKQKGETVNQIDNSPSYLQLVFRIK